MKRESADAFNAKPLKERAAYFSDGRATVGTIEQVHADKIVRSYVGRVRGRMLAGDDGRVRLFETYYEANAAINAFVSKCARIAAGMPE